MYRLTMNNLRLKKCHLQKSSSEKEENHNLTIYHLKQCNMRNFFVQFANELFMDNVKLEQLSQIDNATTSKIREPK